MKTMLEGGNLLCPVCCTPFDQSKHRKLIDSCGHEICYMCLNSDHCPLCVYNTSESYRPRVKTNGHFTKYMQARHGSNSVRKTMHACPPAPQSVMVSSPQLPRARRTWRHPQWPGHLYSDSQTAFSDDELQSHSRCSSKQDLYMRLGLLLGDNMPTGIRKPRSLNHSSQDSYASISSLASSEPNTSPLSVLTDSSDVEPLPLTFHSRPKRDQRSNSVVSLMSTSTSTGHSSSSSPMGTMFQRHVPARTSDSFVQRAKRSITHGRISHVSDESVHKLAELGRRNYFSEVINEKLKPLYFEVPQTEVEPLFIGRQWLFREIEQELSLESKGKKVIVITGGPGSGKTAIASQLIAHSCFRNLREEHIYHDVQSLDGSDYNMSNSGSSDSGVYQSITALHQDTVHSLGNRIVAYHYCQSDNYLTCHVPEFVHSIAAHLSRAPQLVAYRELLVRDLRIQNYLSMPSCIADPSAAFIHGILEPLHNLKCHNRIPNITCLILIEGLHEAEFHRPDYGDTIATFLLRHIHLFPLWLKMILTVRSSFSDVVKPFSARYLSLDKLSGNENLQKDLTSYILFRINSSPAMRANITVNNSKLEGSSSYRFANHLAGLSKGCMLYLRLALDLIEKGYLVVKSSSYRVLPVSLNEVYLLNCNLKFTTIKSFEKVKNILQICLATLYPLTLDELFQMVNAMYVSEPISWDDFMQRMDTLTSGPFLVVRQDGTVMFAHPSMREWLVKREENENTRFLCETRTGHAAIAFHLSRCGKHLSSEEVFELGHHILKAHIYKSIDRQFLFPCLPRDLQAFWVNIGSTSIEMALGCFRNIYSPNVKVSRLLLLAGASPHHAVISLGNAPILSLSACHGHTEMTGLLIEFGASINSTSDLGVGALALACQKGHLEIVRLLLERGAKINQVDNNGFCPTVHAASNGHLEVIMHLMQCDWPNDHDDGPMLAIAAQRALVAAAESGHVNICEFLLDMHEVQVNGISDLTGHTALTAASFAGHTRVCEVLLLRGASVINTNDNGQPPLACAAAEGHWEVVEKLLLHNAPINQRDANARTPLMLAAMCGHPVLELLLSKGAPTELCDKDGATALCLACLKGHYQAAQCLLSHGANANHADVNGRTPLDFAAYSGDSDIVQLLLDSGAVLEHVDATGIRPLDRAIAHKNTAAVIRFLNKGAKLGSQTWEMAEGNPRILYLLLTKLLEDATVLYKRMRLKDAAHRYQYALKKFPSDSSLFHDSQFQQLKYQLYLGLSQCKRKMKENQAAVDAAEQAIALNSKAFEGYYARARALEELGLHKSALKDIMEAFHLAPQNPEIRKVIMRLKEEISACDTSNLEASAGVENCVSVLQKQTSSVPEQMIEQLQSLALDLSDLGHTKDRMQDSGCESNN